MYVYIGEELMIADDTVDWAINLSSKWNQK